MHSKTLVGTACGVVMAVCAFGLTATAGATVRARATHNPNPVTITEAGSTLVLPIIAEWAAAWDNSTGNTVQYGGGGSGQGESEVAQNLIDIGASDAPLAAYSGSSTPCSNCVQIPWGLTATGVSFNIDNGKVHSLHLTGSVLAKIYLGQIKNWNNSAIEGLNPSLHKYLPKGGLPIAVFYRSDASGDSFAFSSYLADVSKGWKNSVGASTQPTFPTGTGAKGNGAMASSVQNNNGAIAYVAVSYLANDGLPAAAIKNRAGNWEVPNLGPIENAASSIHHVPSNNQLTIVDPPQSARSAYVISTFTYAMLPRSGSRQGSVSARPIKQFIYYALHGGQQFAAALDFAHIPSIVLNAADNTLNSVH